MMPELFCAACAKASTTRTTKDVGPAVVGMPDTRPVDGFSVRPGGSEPAASDQVNGPVPPVSVSWPL